MDAGPLSNACRSPGGMASATGSAGALFYQQRSLHRRDAEAAAADTRAALDAATQTGAARCIDLAYALINRLDGRTERPVKELRAYVREHLQT
jgi:hypothetical protein